MPTPSANLGHGMEIEKNDSEGYYQLSMTYARGEEDITVRLAFLRISAFKATFHHACNADMIKWAYDQLVDLGSTEWLNEISRQIASRERVAPSLRHLMICFDDGPCFEFLCDSYSISTDSRPRASSRT
jgi:hypothetical protein